jgi:hypothetical protein
LGGLSKVTAGLVQPIEREAVVDDGLPAVPVIAFVIASHKGRRIDASLGPYTSPGIRRSGGAFQISRTISQ